MNTLTETTHHEGISSVHPMLTILIFAALLAAIVAAGCIVSQQRHGQQSEPASNLPSLFERILPTGR